MRHERKTYAVARREKPPFEDAAAWFRSRNYRSRDIDAVPDLNPYVRIDCRSLVSNHQPKHHDCHSHHHEVLGEAYKPKRYV